MRRRKGQLLAVLVVCVQLVAGRSAPSTQQSQQWEQWLKSRLGEHERRSLLQVGAAAPGSVNTGSRGTIENLQFIPQLQQFSGEHPGGGFTQFQNPPPAGTPPTPPKLDTEAPCVPSGGIAGGSGQVIPTGGLISIPENYNFVQLADYFNAKPQELLLRPIPTKVGPNGILTQAQYNIFTQPSTVPTPAGFTKWDANNALTDPKNSHFVFLYALQDTLRQINTAELFAREKHDRLQICDMLAVYALARAGIKDILPEAAAFYRRITADHCFIGGGAAIPPVCPPGVAPSVLPAGTTTGPAGYIYITQAVAADLAAAVLAFQNQPATPTPLDQLAFQTKFLNDLCDKYEGPTGLDVLKDAVTTTNTKGFNSDLRILTQLQLVKDFTDRLAAANAAVGPPFQTTFAPGVFPSLASFAQPLFATWPEYLPNPGKAVPVPAIPTTWATPVGGSVPVPPVPAGTTLVPGTTSPSAFALGTPRLDPNAAS